MKLYQKKRFVCGIACLVLAMICGAAMAAEGVSVKLAVSALLLTALGGGDLLLSMDKNMQMPRPDERDPAGSANKCLAGLSNSGSWVYGSGNYTGGGLWGMADAGAAGRPGDGMAGGAGVLWNSAGMQPLL